MAIGGKRHSKRVGLWAISRGLCASICCALVCARRARSREWARLRESSCAARAPWIAGPTNHGVARCMDSILERMRGKQSKCLAIRPPGGHIFQCVPLIGLGARMAACWRPGELPSGGAAVEVLSINRPPTGGDLTFSWKEGHICTVVLLEVPSLVTVTAVSWAAGHGRPMANSSS